MFTQGAIAEPQGRSPNPKGDRRTPSSDCYLNGRSLLFTYINKKRITKREKIKNTSIKETPLDE
jgi:hypothetical protein